MPLGPLDDLLAHQTTETFDRVFTSDRNFYDRYYFNLHASSDELFLVAGMGQYPNLGVTDAFVAISHRDTQYVVRASRELGANRLDTKVGPFSVEVLEGLRRLRLRLEPNQWGVAFDVVFDGSVEAIEEPKQQMRQFNRLTMDTSRFAQVGGYTGTLEVGGQRYRVSPDRWKGVRDHSWGVRPVGEPEAGAPGRLSRPGVHWVWTPLHFGDLFVHYGTFQDPDGRPTQLSGCLVPRHASPDAIPRGEDPGVREMAEMRHEIRWRKGTRWPEGAALHFVSREGQSWEIELEPMLRFQMHGIGYQHPNWAHGCWRGELVTAAESWRLDELDPLLPQHVHAHTLCRARLRGDGRVREGHGLLETIAFGPHAPSGLRSLLDGAP